MAFHLVGRRYHHFARYRFIAEVLIRHGFGYLIEQLDLSQFIPLRKRVLKLDKPVRRLALGRRLRLVLEELGPTYIKLGQVLSTRPDVLPMDVIQELERLQDRVPPVEFAGIQRQVEGALDRPLTEMFREFDPQPVAGASIGQVHAAVLSAGESVMVKVQRPGIHRVVETDLEILIGLARLAQDRLSPELFSPVELIEEFSRIIRREMDYTNEGRNIERFYSNFQGFDKIHIPKVFWEFSSGQVLTMERIDGIKINDIGRLDAAGIDRRAVARRGAEAFMKQVMIDGFFHGDPHPGNIFIESDGTVAFLDFGMVGRVDESTMDAIANLFIGIIRRDVDRVVEGMTSIGILSEDADLKPLKRDMSDMIDRHYGKSLREIKLGDVLNDALELNYKHHIRMPTDFLLLGRALITMEGIGQSLDPEFNAVRIAEPFATELIKRRYHPSRLTRRFLRGSESYLEILGELPGRVNRTLAKAESGRLEIRFRHAGLESLIHRLDLVSNRLGFSLIIAALIIGSSLIMQGDRGPQFAGFPVIGLLGYLIAGLLGIWLIISILRSGRI